ncbi:ATP-binding protein, partial [Candidatus Symbiopectobacterium sp.]
YGQTSTILISQLPVEQWYGVMENPTAADAFLDRLIHNAHRLELKGE